MNIRFTLLFLAFALLSILPVLGQSHWETVIYAEDEWSYFEGVTAPDSQWKSPTFVDSLWKKGNGGLGYGDGDDNTVVSSTTVLFSRIDFIVKDTSDIISAIIHADYDDGIIIYLNGHEIVRSGVEGENPDYTTLATANHEAQVYKGGNPEMFVIDSEKLSDYLLQDTNTLAVQVHNVTIGSSDLSSIVYFSVELASEDSLYRPTPSWFFKPEVISSTLPLIVITTDETISKAAKITGQMKIINNTDGSLNTITDPGNEYDGYIGIKIRGNQSSSYAQKPYSIETRDSLGENNNVPLFGFPKENDWNLVNNLKDKSCINHAIGYEISRKMGFWAANTRHCEVVVNGEPKGIYVFMESLKVDDNRVDIAKLKPEEITEPDVSGGYIFKVDYYTKDLSDCWQAWYHPSNGAKTVHYVYHTPEPEDIVEVQKEYIQDFVENFERVLYSDDFKDPESGYRAYINVPSYINYLLVNEIALNCDAYKKSCHFNKDKNRDNVRSLLNAGPVWDMDWAFRDYPNQNNPTLKREGFEYLKTVGSSVTPTPNTWMARLMEDSQFANEVRTTYEDFRTTVITQDYLMHFIDSIVEDLKPALERHYELWYNDGANAEDLYLAEVELLKTFVSNRLLYLDENLAGNVIDRSDFLPSPITYMNTTGLLAKEAASIDFRIYPNPASDYLNIRGKDIKQVRIFASNGHLVLDDHYALSNELMLDVSFLTTGLYMVQIANVSGERVTQKLQIMK